MACYFCQHNNKEIDFKNIKLLKNFVSGLYKIRAKEKTTLCSKHQRKIAQAIKRARFLALLPYTPR